MARPAEEIGCREVDLKAASKSGARGPKESTKRSRKFGIAGVVILICAVVAALVAVDYWINSGKIYRGVQVGAVALGGMTPSEGREALKERAVGPLKEIEFTGPERSTQSAEKMGVEVNAAATVERAFAVGREGDVLRRLTDRIRAAYGTVIVPAKVDFRPEAARAEVRRIAARLNEKPENASVSVDGQDARVSGASEGYKVNEKATLENVALAVEDMTGEAEIAGKTLSPDVSTGEAEGAAKKIRRATSEELVLMAQGRRWMLQPAAVGAMLNVAREGGDIEVGLDRDRLRGSMAGVYGAFSAEPVDASYQVNGSGVTITPGRTGKVIEEEKLFGDLEAGIFEGRHAYEVPIQVERPQFTTAQAEKLAPTTLLGEYRTNYLTYDDSPGRVTNLKTASNAVNNTLLAPGEIFSFNELAAPLEYADTKVIINGRVEEAEGGGLCQVSSTLYMAANHAGLEVVERHPHSAELPYIRPGLDATVWFGSLDMRFKNNSGSYVLLRERVDESTGNVYAEVWGRPFGREIQMTSRQVSATGGTTEWVTYQTVKQDGKVVSDGVLHTDTYEPLKS